MLEQLAELSFDAREVVGVDAASPEIRAVEIVTRLITQPVLDVLADKGRPEVTRRLEAVDYRRRGREQLLDMGACRGNGRLGRFALGDVAP